MIYLDHHSTTPCDQRVIAAMLPWLTDHFGNPHSNSHQYGRTAGEAIEQAIGEIASLLQAPSSSVVMTSGATESNNLAIRGVCLHPRQKRRHIVTVSNEHSAVLDVVAQLQRDGFRVTQVPVHPAGTERAGIVDLDRLAHCIDDDTALVSVMWANNEIGAIAPIRQIAELAHARGALLHSDATQAVGHLDVSLIDDDVDLLSLSAHKFYGPKGTGALIVGNGNRRVRLLPQIVGGGQQGGLRGGTMNPAGVIGLATALRIAVDEIEFATEQTRRLRDQLYQRLTLAIEPLTVNGPPLDSPWRLTRNLNVTLPEIEGQTWMIATPDVAFSSGSACSSVDPKPSHVLLAMGIDESMARRSVRFGVGRFNTTAELEDASIQLIDAYQRMRRMKA